MPKKYPGVTLGEWDRGVRKKKTPLGKKILIVVIAIALVAVGFGLVVVL
jgi:hypothetical protein